MSAKTLRRNRCQHEVVEEATWQAVLRRFCVKCGAVFPIPT